MGCGDPGDGRILGTRPCLVTVGEESRRITLGPGHYIPIALKLPNGDPGPAYRLTLVGARPIRSAGDFVTDVVVGGALARTRTDVGVPLDVSVAGKSMGAIQVGGTSTGDPVALIADSGVRAAAKDVNVSVYPRTELEFRLITEEQIPWLWGGLTIILIALLVGGILPSYSVVASRNAEGLWTADVSGVGLLARPARVLELLMRELEARSGA